MSDRETPSKPGSTPAPAPFVRVQAQWGKPPPVIFRAGPLPKSADLSWAQPPAGMRPPASAQQQQQRQPTPQPAPQARSGGILRGSMVPPPRPAAPEPARATAPEPVAAPVAAPIAPPVMDTTVRPLPPAPQRVSEPTPEPQPAPQPSAPPAPRIAPAELTPTPVQTAPVHAAPVQAAPAAPVYATAAAKRSSRLPLYLGLALGAAAVIAGGIWLAGRGSAPAPMAPLLPTTGVAADPVLDATPLSSEPAPVIAEPPAAQAIEAPNPAPTTSATPPGATTRPSVSASVPASVPAARPVTRPATPATSAPSPTQSLNRQPAQAPAIETQPLAVPPAGPQPTAAQPAAADPDAPIETRPQPLN
ncbi:hypothetical protein [Brevundimonas sp.]|uniref:hypothetical protein n=1 Tax=Brevundimonas sp. TaxID=1871086 RepID=UPI003BA99249